MLKSPIESNIIENIKEELQKIRLPEEIVAVYLYGSILKGKLRTESDIDVAILPDYKVDEMQALELISKVESLLTKIFKSFGIFKEIGVLNMRGKFVSIELLFDIQMNGVCVYEKSIEQHLEFKNFVAREYFIFKPYLEKLRAQKYELLSKKN